MTGCPLCGRPLRQEVSSRKQAYLLCTGYPGCKMAATPEVVNAMTHLLANDQRKDERLDECRRAVQRMAELYADARGDNRSEWVQTPLPIGEYIGKVAEVAIERSRRKARHGR